MTTDTPSAEALADKLNIICHATGITACLNAAAMLRSLASERDALRAALDAMRKIVEGLAQQQAMPDDWWLAALEDIDLTTPPQQEPTA